MSILYNPLMLNQAGALSLVDPRQQAMNRRDLAPMSVPKPSLGEALIAMGGAGVEAALDKGDAFGGMARGLAAYQQQQKENQLDAARIEATRAATAGSQRQQAGSLYYDNNRNAYREVFDPRSGGTSFYVVSGPQAGQTLDTLPQGTMRAEDSAAKYLSKEDAAIYNQAQGAALAAPGNIVELRRLKRLGESQAGTTVFDQAGRFLATRFGLEVGPFDADNITAYKQELAKKMLAAAGQMKGQGQITENERKLLADTIANPESMTGASFAKAMEIMIRGEERAKAKFEAWNNADALTKSMGFSRFSYDWTVNNLNNSRPDGAGNNDPFTFDLDNE